MKILLSLVAVALLAGSTHAQYTSPRVFLPNSGGLSFVTGHGPVGTSVATVSPGGQHIKHTFVPSAAFKPSFTAHPQKAYKPSFTTPPQKAYKPSFTAKPRPATTARSTPPRNRAAPKYQPYPRANPYSK